VKTKAEPAYSNNQHGVS